MRTIKFRGKASRNKDMWLYGDLVKINNSYHILGKDDMIEDGHHIKQDSDIPTWVDEKTIGQFTGLLDKNGKEIYEGDILKVYYYGKSKVFGFVRFDDARFYIDDEFLRNELKVKAPMTELFSHYQFEVIGNIHDNPELIKEE